MSNTLAEPLEVAGRLLEGALELGVVAFVAEVAASELGISMAALDQLLWWDTQPE